VETIDGSKLGGIVPGRVDVEPNRRQNGVDAPFFIVYTDVGVYYEYLEEYELCRDGGLDMDFFGSGNLKAPDIQFMDFRYNKDFENPSIGYLV
jgi:hypothetical protein